MKYINLTPHDINIVTAEGKKVNFPKSGKVAGIKEVNGVFNGLVRSDNLSDVQGLPKPQKGVIYIVSMPTLLAVRASGDGRKDLVCPITRGAGVVKKNGQIISVPGLRTF